jgi:hypothetical protein
MRMIMLVALVSGCESMDATGNPMKPVAAPVVSEPAPAAPEGTPEPTQPDGGTEEGFDFDADAQREDPDGDAPIDPIALLALQQGVVLEDAPTPDPALAAEPVAEPEPVVAEPVDVEPVYAWDPETAGPSTWGVRLLSTMNSTLPPRAVIGLPDGSEQVVQPGTMLAEHGLIIMAVGQNIIEVAQVVPDGVQARVETRTITALFAQ